jgi:hypothetical protein
MPPTPDLEAHASLLLVWLDRGFVGDDPAAFLHARGIISEVVGTPCERRSYPPQMCRLKTPQS